MKTIVANWKMRLGVRESVALARGVLRGLRGLDDVPNVYLAPTFPALVEVGKVLGRSRVRMAAQTIHHELDGPYTGEVSAKVVKEVGAKSVIIGHSSRRAAGVTDGEVANKIALAVEQGLDIILCVGESAASKEAGETLGVVHDQLHGALASVTIPRSTKLMIAYEPVWAIGTGKWPTIHDVADVHAAIRDQLAELDISDVLVLYGGSVTPENAYEFLSHSSVDGALVGGASVRIAPLMEIIQTASEL